MVHKSVVILGIIGALCACAPRARPSFQEPNSLYRSPQPVPESTEAMIARYKADPAAFQRQARANEWAYDRLVNHCRWTNVTVDGIPHSIKSCPSPY